MECKFQNACVASRRQLKRPVRILGGQLQVAEHQLHLNLKGTQQSVVVVGARIKHPFELLLNLRPQIRNIHHVDGASTFGSYLQHIFLISECGHDKHPCLDAFQHTGADELPHNWCRATLVAVAELALDDPIRTADIDTFVSGATTHFAVESDGSQDLQESTRRVVTAEFLDNRLLVCSVDDGVSGIDVHRGQLFVQFLGTKDDLF